MPTFKTNTTLKSYSALNATAISVNIERNSDSTGTIIFGVIASVLALMAIIIGILQLRKTQPQADEGS
jgi:hypothetical protein